MAKIDPYLPIIRSGIAAARAVHAPDGQYDSWWSG